MKKLLYTVILVLSTALFVSAQSIQIKEAPSIAQLMNKFVEINKATVSVDGWRIQILATTDRFKMENAKQQFQYRYPNIVVNWVHEKPYYKLRVGAFDSKLEATRMLYILKRDYPGAYPAKDRNIRPQELAGYF